MKLRALVTYYLDDKSPPRIVYEVWVHDLTVPDHPRKLPDRLGTYASLRYAERARQSFDLHRVAIELEQALAARERRTTEQDAQVQAIPGGPRIDHPGPPSAVSPAIMQRLQEI